MTTAALTDAEQTIIDAWDRHADHVLAQFAKEGEGGWEFQLEGITYRFVYKGPAKRRRAGSAPRDPRRIRFARKAYEVVGIWAETRVTVERFER